MPKEIRIAAALALGVLLALAAPPRPAGATPYTVSGQVGVGATVNGAPGVTSAGVTTLAFPSFSTDVFSVDILSDVSPLAASGDLAAQAASADALLSGNSPLTGGNLVAAVSALIYNGALAAAANPADANAIDAAIQVVIWEEQYGGSLFFSAADPSVPSLANSYFHDVYFGNWIPPGDEALYEYVSDPSVPNQTVAFLAPSDSIPAAPVPEPPTWVLLPGAVLIFAALRLGPGARRRG